jgi:hypothetical protein
VVVEVPQRHGARRWPVRRSRRGEPPVDEFTYLGNYDSWRLLAKNVLAVQTSVGDAYLITVQGPCHDLPFANAIALTSTGFTVRRNLDSVRVGRETCTIRDTRPTEPCLKQGACPRPVHRACIHSPDEGAGTMNGKSRLISVGTAVSLVVLAAGAALSAQDKNSVSVPNGLEFSEFRGYESWETISVSENSGLVAVILGNPAMIDAYKAGIPGNGKPFPDGAGMAKIHWSPKKNETAPVGQRWRARFMTWISW